MTRATKPSANHTPILVSGNGDTKVKEMARLENDEER